MGSSRPGRFDRHGGQQPLCACGACARSLQPGRAEQWQLRPQRPTYHVPRVVLRRLGRQSPATTTPRDPAARPCGADRGGVAGIAHPHGAGLVASGSVVAAAFVRSMRRSEVCRVRARDGQRSDRSVLATVWLGVYGLFSLYYYCVVQYLVGGRASTGRGFPSVPAQRLRKRPSLSNPDVTSQAKHVRSPDQMFTLDAADGSTCIISACTICVNTHFPSRMC